MGATETVTATCYDCGFEGEETATPGEGGVSASKYGRQTLRCDVCETKRDELRKYARQTQADMGGTYAEAVESMRANSPTVADDLGIEESDVTEWCAT